MSEGAGAAGREVGSGGSFFLSVDEKIFCCYCHVDISEKLHLRCAECSSSSSSSSTPTSSSSSAAASSSSVAAAAAATTTTSTTTSTTSLSCTSSSFNLCADCFSSGVELYPHKNTHPYQVVDCLHRPLFSKDWTVWEEMKLLEGIKRFGLGNWKKINEFISSKTPRACEEHYWELYLGLFGRCLPKETIVGETLVPTESLLPEAADFVAPGLREQVEKTLQSNQLKDSSVLREPPLKTEKNLDGHQNGSCSDHSIYGSLKEQMTMGEGDGSTEHAKSVCKEAEGDHEITCTEILKNELLAQQLNLVNVPPPEATATNCSDIGTAVERFKGSSRDRSSTGGSSKSGGEAKKEQEIRDRIAQMPGADLAGYMPIRKDFDIEHDNEAEMLLTDLVFHPTDYPAETDVKLSVVQAYNNRLAERDRRKSFAIERGLVDLRRQQHADRRRPKEDKTILGHLKVFQRFQSEELYAALCEGVSVARRLKKQIEAYKQYRRMGIRTLDQARAFETDRKKREHQIKAMKSKQVASNLDESAYVFTSSQSELVSCVESTATGSSDKEESESLRRAQSLVKEAPGSALLSKKEVDFCARVGMLPLHFVAVQEAVAREAFRNGTLTMEGLRRVVKVQHSPHEAGGKDDSSSGQKKRKSSRVLNVNEEGVTADVSMQLFDFFVENAAFGEMGIVSAKSSSVCSSATPGESPARSSVGSRQSKRLRSN